MSGGNAIVQVSTSNPVAMAVHEWRGGQLTTISTSAGLTVLDQIATSGPWAIWTRRFGGSGTLIRRNFVTGTGDTLATNAGGQAYDVTATGDVAYWTDDRQVHLFHNGTDTQMTTMGSNLYPQTDGVRTVYLSGGGDHGDILLQENGEIDTLALDAGALAYDVANGWVAFMRPLPGGNAQVWVRSPDGQLRALSPAGQFVTFKAVGDSGDVIYESQNQGWRVKAGGMPESVGPSGRYLFIGGQLHVIIGASLFAIH